MTAQPVDRDALTSESALDHDRRRFLKLAGVMTITGAGVVSFLAFRDNKINLTPSIHGLLKLGRTAYKTIHPPLSTNTSLFDPTSGISVVRPERDQTGYWVGAPYPLISEDKIYVYYRYRDPQRRGWKAVVAESNDGENFDPIIEINRNDINAVSLEGGAITREDGEYTLYLSYNDQEGNQWKIQSIRSEDISTLDVSDGTDLDFELPCNLYHVKDAVPLDSGMVVHANSRRFISNPTLLAHQVGANKYSINKEITINSENFSRFRITSVIKRNDQNLVFFDGERSAVFTWEEKASVALTSNFNRFETLLNNGVIQFRHGTHSLRYIRAVPQGDELWIYYEISMEGGGHEIKVNKIPMSTVDEFITKSSGI